MIVIRIPTYTVMKNFIHVAQSSFSSPNISLLTACGHVQVNPAAHPMKALRAQTNQTKSTRHVASHRLGLPGIYLTWNNYNPVVVESGNILLER